MLSVAKRQSIKIEHLYFEKKRFHSKIVNANLYGAAHDSFICQNLMVYWRLEQNYYRGKKRCCLKGDNHYLQQPWLVTPIRNTIEVIPKHTYDDSLKQTRNCMERYIGILKSRFRCLLKERMLRYDLFKVGTLLMLVVFCTLGA